MTYADPLVVVSNLFRQQLPNNIAIPLNLFCSHGTYENNLSPATKTLN